MTYTCGRAARGGWREESLGSGKVGDTRSIARRSIADPLNQGPSSLPPKMPRPLKAARSASFNPCC